MNMIWNPIIYMKNCLTILQEIRAINEYVTKSFKKTKQSVSLTLFSQTFFIKDSLCWRMILLMY